MTTFVWQYGNTTVDIEADTEDEAYNELRNRLEEARVNLQIDVGNAGNFEVIARF